MHRVTFTSISALLLGPGAGVLDLKGWDVMGLQTILSSQIWSGMAIYYLFFLISIVAAKSAVVDLGYTKYEGRSLASGVSQWLGMRYAAPPVGELRFAAPQDPFSENGVQQASQVWFSSCLTISPSPVRGCLANS